jgi:hypothetical protein
MIAGMRPVRRPGAWLYVTEPDPARAAALLPEALAAFREDEGMSLILPAARAAALGYPAGLPMACLTLTLHSALDGVGLTAAIAAALTADGIPANVVAAFHHDHVFVPEDRAADALAALERASAAAR